MKTLYHSLRNARHLTRDAHGLHKSRCCSNLCRKDPYALTYHPVLRFWSTMAFAPPPLFELKPNPTAIKSLYNTDQGLFPKGKNATENNQIVTQSLNLKEEDAVSPFPLLITSLCSPTSGKWTPRHKGYTKDNRGMLTAFELTDEQGIPTGFFLCYSYVCTYNK